MINAINAEHLALRLPDPAERLNVIQTLCFRQLIQAPHMPFKTPQRGIILMGMNTGVHRQCRQQAPSLP
jgi:hypothetical protein